MLGSSKLGIRCAAMRRLLACWCHRTDVVSGQDPFNDDPHVRHKHCFR
jgi:hypothetical protein